MPITKVDLCQKIAEKTGLQHQKVKRMVQMTLDNIIDAIVEDGHFELRNFGVFEIKERPPRKGRNPRTGETCFSKGCRTVKFKPGKTMDAAVKNS